MGDMLRPLVFASLLPVALIYLTYLLPSSLKDPYAWLDPVSLNTPAQDGRARQWLNMGYWEGTQSFSDAAELLGRRLLEFADAPEGGQVLDIAHGSGESLLLHLSSSPVRTRIDALTSRKADTAHARSLVFAHKTNHSISTPVEFYTASAVPRLGSVADQDHPLNPMRGYLGSAPIAPSEDDNEEEFDVEMHEHDQDFFDIPPDAPDRSTRGYNLIYVLDAIYHFPPSLPSFLALTQKALAPGGVVAYTDVLPPPRLNPLLARLLSLVLGVPLPNLVSRPGTLQGYKAELEEMGYVDVRLEDWSKAVWPGFARDLNARRGLWAMIGSVVRRAEATGWRFVVVRARRDPHSHAV